MGIYSKTSEPIIVKQSNFEKALRITLLLEGNEALSLNKSDPGNWTGGKVGVGKLKGTKYGIAASAYPDLDIPNITLQDAMKIYKNNYWDKCLLDSVEWPMCAAVFDFAVQSGPSRALSYYRNHPGFNEYMTAREAFLASWSNRNPGNRGVLFRVERLKSLIAKEGV